MTYSIQDIVRLLVEAHDHFYDYHDCDYDGWETWRDAKLAARKWLDQQKPTPRGAVERPDDMSQKGKLRLFVEDDGDIIVAVHEEVQDEQGQPMVGAGADVQICAPFTGGGHSPETWEALHRLAIAMHHDNESRKK